MTEPPQTKPIVALVRCCSYDQDQVNEAIDMILDSLGGLERFIKPQQQVLIKPNFIAPRPSRHATQTHPAVIIAIARIIKDYGARPFIADSPAWSTAFECARVLKLDEPLKYLGVPIRQLDKPVKRKIGNHNIKISSAALEADVIFNLPKFKAHQQLVATFAIKNMFGCVPGKQKALWHFRKGKDPRQFCQMLIDIYRYLAPAVTLIDGITAMDGQGPIQGRTRPLGWLIAGIDPIACETVCARLVDMKTDELPIVRVAKSINFGCADFDKVRIAGDDFPEQPCTDFIRANQMPLRFSLPHIMKSVTKQILLLLRAKPRDSGQSDY